jgi:hypothetical protein
MKVGAPDIPQYRPLFSASIHSGEDREAPRGFIRSLSNLEASSAARTCRIWPAQFF